MNHIETLHQLITRSVTPYHCIMEAERQLSGQGFCPLDLSSPWSLEPSKGYYIKIFDSTLVAFTLGRELSHRPSIRIGASHTDWPCLKLKPSPEVATSRYGKLNVEVYGGPLLGTWLDRPLSMAGKVCAKGRRPLEPATIFFDFKRPMATIPNLAIHMNKEANDGVKLNPQVDLLPILSILDQAGDREEYFLKLLAEEAKVPKEDILDYEICLYNADQGTLLGAKEEFYSAPRLDNLTSVQACLSGIMGCTREKGLSVIALYDNEEIGSQTKQGAASTLMERVLEKIFLSLGYPRQAFLDSLFDGFLLSLDVAHGAHPNYLEKSDIKNQVALGDGVALKLASSQSYATDATSTSIIEGLCQAEHIPYKKYSNRSDIKGGSTLGNISSSRLNMRTVDLGVPLLAMHSAREMMGAKDQAPLVSLVQAFFNA